MDRVARAICLLMFGSCVVIANGCGEGQGSSEFTVRGNVAGLDGTLILQLNGANDLTITNDGPYVFDVFLQHRAAYEVTVHTQPSNQNCSLTNASGTITQASATDVNAVCVDKGWAGPSGTSDAINPPGEVSFYVDVAMSDNGDAVIVWPQSDGIDDQIFVSEYRNGSWTHPSDANDNISPDGERAGRPRVAMDDEGNTIVVWQQSNGVVPQIFMSEYRNGRWTHPVGLSNFISLAAGEDASDPQVAMDDNGNALIAWEQGVGGASRIFVSQYRNETWVHPGHTSHHVDVPSGYSGSPRPVMDDGGNAIVAWQQNVNGIFQAFKSEYRKDIWVYPADEADDISPDGQNTHDIDAAMDNQQNAIIVWQELDGTAAQVFMSEYRNGAWMHPADLSDNISPDGEWCSYPRVAMNDAGTALIVWKQSNSGQDRTFLSEYRDGTWTHPATLADHISPDGDSEYVDEPKVALDRHGNALIAWGQTTGPSPSPIQVFKSEYRRGQWTHPQSLQDYISLAGTTAGEPAIAMDNNGDAIIVWHQEVGGETQIFKSEYR